MIATKKYRYRDSRGSTHHCLESFYKHISKLGRVTKVKGYVYHGAYQVNHSAVMIYGENGTMRLRGLGWGYSGQGPRGTEEVLKYLNVPQKEIDRIMVIPHDWNKPRTVWEIKVEQDVAVA